jgi:peptide chain release factor 1
MDESKKYLQDELAQLESKIRETEELLKDASLAGMAIGELVELKKQKASLELALVEMDKQKLQEDASLNFNTVLLEARPGVGGDEAKIWADDLLRMYRRYAEIMGWGVEQIDGVVLQIKSKGVFSKLKWETGVHRVQRVPDTEAAGRIHTSTASIVVLPEIPETEITIREDELVWEFMEVKTSTRWQQRFGYYTSLRA